MSRIAETFAGLRQTGRGGLIPFITAGDPDLATTELLLIELAKAGANIIEVGFPFSDPVADGKVIQRASQRALKKGVTLSDTLLCISRAKKRVDVPIVLFSYLNPILKFGAHRLADKAKEAGVDAVLVTDLVPEEAEPWMTAFRNRNMDFVFLVAPTTSDKRLAFIAQRASGFIYAVSRAGVTGERDEMPPDAEPLLKRVRAVSDLPVAVGFGISTVEQVRQVWRFADAAVIGSAIVRQIEELVGTADLVSRVGELARSFLNSRFVDQ
jgi:tryptophan synthase alpha chain